MRNNFLSQFLSFCFCNSFTCQQLSTPLLWTQREFPKILRKKTEERYTGNGFSFGEGEGDFGFLALALALSEILWYYFLMSIKSTTPQS